MTARRWVALSLITAALVAGAFVLTPANPGWPVASRIPNHDVRVMLGWRLAPAGTHGHRVLTGPAAEAFAASYNRLPVMYPGARYNCPLLTAGADISIVMTADGHTWHVDFTNCPPLYVRKDGRAVPALVATKVLWSQVRRSTGHYPGDPALGIPVGTPPSH